MAKWGEGDPRWIVEERADATNVNNWHWTEKNATNWSKDKLKELLVGFTIENDEICVKIKEITKLEGEASANNRKAKLIFFYEWVINGDWEAAYKNSENKTVYKGSFDVQNLSEEYDPKDVDVSISIKDSKQTKIKDFMRSVGVKELRSQFTKYLSLLKDEFSQGLILPSNKDGTASTLKNSNSSAGVPPAATLTASPSTTITSAPSNSSSKPSNEGTKIVCKKLSMNEEFKCRAKDLYQVFVDLNLVRAFTQNSIKTYEPEKGGKFSLFDGNVSGSFIDLIPNKNITMYWRNKRWPDEHYSLVNLEFNEKEDCTILALTQSGIPQNFIENTEDGWRNFYFNSIRQTFGFGSRLF